MKLDYKAPFWFLDETFTYFILQRSLEGVKEEEIQLDINGRSLSLEVPSLNIEEQIDLPMSIDVRGIFWVLNDGMLTLTLEKAPLGRAIRVSLEKDEAGSLYGEYRFDHMFPPNHPPEAYLDDEGEG